MINLVRNEYVQFEVPYNFTLPSSADEDKENNFFPGITISKNTDGRIRIVFAISDTHLNEPCTSLSVKLKNVTKKEMIIVSETERQEVILESNNHYILSIKLDFSNTSISGTRTLSCEFIPEN